MAPPKPQEVPVTFIDDPRAPELYAAEAMGFFIHNGVVSITFTNPRVDHSRNPGPVNRVVIGRIAMPLAGAQALAAGLYDFLTKQGADPVPRPALQAVN